MNFIQKLFHSEPNFEVHFNIEENDENDIYRLPYFRPDVPIFIENDMIKGSIDIVFKENNQPIIHNGIDISVIGQFRNVNSNNIDQFFIHTSNLSNAGTINDNSTINFDLEPICCSIPSYYGTFFDSRYVLEVKINNYTFTKPFYYITFMEVPPSLIEISEEEHKDNILYDIGIEGILRITAIFRNFYFETSEIIYGILHFETIKLKIVGCFFQIQREETYQNKLSSFKHKSNVCKYQLLDGIPCHGDTVPVRVFLPGVRVWPYPKTESNLKVKYIIRLLFIDVNGKTYNRIIGDFIYRSNKDLTKKNSQEKNQDNSDSSQSTDSS